MSDISLKYGEIDARTGEIINTAASRLEESINKKYGDLIKLLETTDSAGAREIMRELNEEQKLALECAGLFRDIAGFIINVSADFRRDDVNRARGNTVQAR